MHTYMHAYEVDVRNFGRKIVLKKDGRTNIVQKIRGRKLSKIGHLVIIRRITFTIVSQPSLSLSLYL